MGSCGRTSSTNRAALSAMRLAPQLGQKPRRSPKAPTVGTLRTLPGCGSDEFADTVGKVSGFSLHAGVAARADERKKLERLCRYISRPAVAEKRLSSTPGGNVRYRLKTPYRDGTTHVIFEPLDFMARLAALVPKPRANLTRFHGVFAPNSKHQALVALSKRGKRIRRVFNIDISICDTCGGAVKVIASIEDPAVIKQILAHLERKAESKEFNPSRESRPPPQPGLFG